MLDKEREGFTVWRNGRAVNHEPACTWCRGQLYSCHLSTARNVNRACKLFNIRIYATLCFNYFRWRRRMFSYGSVFELL